MAFVLLLAGGAVYVHGRQAKHSAPVAHANPPKLAFEPYPVTLSSVRLLAHPDVGQQVPIAVRAASANPIASVQLWDGDRMLESKKPFAGGREAEFTYTPVVPGQHVLTTRTIDIKGLVSESPPAFVTATAPHLGHAIRVPVTLQARDSAATIALRYGVPLAQVIVVRPSGAVVHPPGSAPLAPTDHVNVLPLMKAPTLVAAPTPSGPYLTATVSSCNLTITVHGAAMDVDYGSAGFPGWSDKSNGFADGESRTFANQPVGNFVFEGRYMVGGVLTRTPPAEVTVSPTCFTSSGWVGDAEISQGILYLPNALTDFHLYVGTNCLPALRIPAADGSSLSTAGTTLDISKQLPDLSKQCDGAGHVFVEVWSGSGSTGDGGAASLLATGQLNLSSGDYLPALLGFPQQLTLSVLEPGKAPGTTYDASNGAGSISVDYTNTYYPAKRIMWQVTSVPLTAANTDELPLGLLAIGRQQTSSSAPFFSVPIGKLPEAPIDQGTNGHNGTDLGTELTALHLPTDPSATKGAIIASQVIPKTAAALLGSNAFTPPAPAPNGVVYIRALLLSTFDDGTEANLDIVSNTITVQIPKPKALDDHQLHFTGLKVINAGHAANPALADCIRLLSAPWIGGSAAGYDPTLTGFYTHLGTYCPSDYTPPPGSSCNVFCQFGELVVMVGQGLADVWDDIAATYNEVIADVVSALAKFNPVCLAISGAGSSAASSACQAIAGFVAQAVVDAVLSAVGLPPTLPSAKDLENIAQGDLGALAVDFMQELGVPCDSLATSQAVQDSVSSAAQAAGVDPSTVALAGNPCLAIANALLNHVKTEVQSAHAASLSQASGLPDGSAVPGFVIEPEPTAHIGPVTLQVTASNQNKVPLVGFTCHVTAGGTVFAGDGRFQDADLVISGAGDGFGTFTGIATVLPYDSALEDRENPGDPVDGTVEGACFDNGFTHTITFPLPGFLARPPS